ncbi:MAG: POT family MFS transporter [Planctomycetota bacterium]|nr:POT family MFS transporter [Planctomycetota bacterium]
MYRTTPDSRSTMPSGIPYIVGNEAAERYSFYGMKSILMVFLTTHVFMKMKVGDSSDFMSEAQAENLATQWIHFFGMWVYLLPIAGAILSDWLLGKYRTILWLSIVYCLGHLALAINETYWGMATGLALIAVGAGGIKPCVTAHVGDQFGPDNKHLLPRVFSWFYFSINLGAFTSTLLTPFILSATGERYGGAIAFGIPGVLMAIATFMFWLGRNEFVHIPPRGKQFWIGTFSADGRKAIASLIPVFLLISIFWSCFDQTASRWVSQATRMESNLWGFEILPSQMQAINPILVLLYIPLFTYVGYPLINRIFKLTPLRKMGCGFFLTAIAFSVSALIEMSLTLGYNTHVVWQVVPYIILTAAEIMISITALEFAYTQAPKSAKALVMSLNLGAVALGNLVTLIVNVFITHDDGTSILPGATYYFFFAGLVTYAGILFIGIAWDYRGKTYIEGEQDLS